jgi:hypothetical protein
MKLLYLIPPCPVKQKYFKTERTPKQHPLHLFIGLSYLRGVTDPGIEWF